MSDIGAGLPSAFKSRDPVSSASRNAVLIAMLVVCLDAEIDGAPATKLIDRLRTRMGPLSVNSVADRANFAGDGEFAAFRDLAWQAAERLCADTGGKHDGRWIKILREILRQLPECDALAE